MARGESGSVREGCLPGHGEDAYVMRLIDFHQSLIQPHSHRRRFGRNFDDVFEDGLATTSWREVFAPRDALISSHPGLQEGRSTL